MYRYRMLNNFFYAFDIWDGYRYLDLQSRSEFLRKLGFAEVPFLYSGNDINVVDLLRIADGLSVSNKSRLSSVETIEGIVIKNYEKQLFGKYVRREFLESIEENWLTLPLVENKLASFKFK